MRRILLSGSALAATTIVALILIKIGQQAGYRSVDFLWSLLVCVVVLAVALTLRWFRERS